MDDRRHLAALALEARAEIVAAAEGITTLQAIRHLRDREMISRRVRREFRSN